ncbi:hypothetical protein NDI56_03230 [Haloarcula sp. S1CR25-12]|uniref:Uncharacterized protein n=1 Tax=Haloarcula saliterrae TaxID=2950534 RepID=A0ABU2F831_9EURY|nr:hypothetical protein [Haloarcula sp. S1CR25-12]MDS0258420.1 hypothetical protein [Haloarcula sp. S1CR25-12]
MASGAAGERADVSTGPLAHGHVADSGGRELEPDDGAGRVGRREMSGGAASGHVHR